MDESLEMAEAMANGFRDLIKVEKTQQGIEIETFLRMSDGEPITIVCQQRDGHHVLTDLGCTTFWLEKQLVELTPKRKKILEGIVNDYHARLEGTEIVLDCSRYPESDLTCMICALLRASDIVLLDQRTVKSVFQEDVQSMFAERFPDCEVSKRVSDSRGESFRADVMVPSERPLLVFAVRTGGRSRSAALAVMALSEDDAYDFMVVVDPEGRVPRSDLRLMENRGAVVTDMDGARRIIEGMRSASR